MTNASKVSSVSVLFLAVAMLAFGAFAVIPASASAQEWNYEGTTWDDSPTWNYEGTTWDNTGGDTNGGYLGYADSPTWSYDGTTWDESPTWNYEGTTWDESPTWNYEGTTWDESPTWNYEGTTWDAQCDCDYVYEDGVGYSTRDYGYAPDGTGYVSRDYVGSTVPSFSFRAPSTSYAPNYPQPRPQPQPQPQPQRPAPGGGSQQQQQQQQQQQSGGPINIVNTNNNNNVNNNVNSNSAPVTPVVYSGVSYPVQYVYQQQPVYQPTYPVYPTYPSYPIYPTYPTYNNAYCTISATQGSVANGQPAYLTWSSSGATSAWLSDGIGAVSTNGSLAVRPSVSKTYTLTVSGYGGTNTCSTYVTVQGSYVTLSQIPYTGFDAGPFGNAIYWLSLISFAIAGAYLAVYYLPRLAAVKAGKGGAMTLVGSMLGSRKVAMQEAPVQTPVQATVEAPVETMTPSPIQIDALENLPVAPTAKATMDSMTVVHSKEGEAPRIIITRS